MAEPMDLSQNVFQDGTWGTLRCATPIMSPGHNGGGRHWLAADMCLQELCLHAGKCAGERICCSEQPARLPLRLNLLR